MQLRICTIIFSLLIFQVSNVFAEEKEWTFLVFLNAHNNLDSYGDMNIKQMEKIGSSEKINIVVQWASLSAETTKSLYIVKSENPEEIVSPVVDDPGLVDMGNYENLIEFVHWGIEKYPAKHYLVAVWNHGSGWHKQNFSATDISFDDISNHSLTS